MERPNLKTERDGRVIGRVIWTFGHAGVPARLTRLDKRTDSCWPLKHPSQAMSGQGHDAKFFQRGKIQVCMVTRVKVSRLLIGPFQEFRQELQAAETKDKKYTKRKTVLKKIVANITMGNDSSCCNPPGASRFCLMKVRCSVASLRRRRAVHGDTFIRDQEECAHISSCLFIRPIRTVRLVVYLFLINYGRSKADAIHMVMPNFLQVSKRLFHCPASSDAIP